MLVSFLDTGHRIKVAKGAHSTLETASSGRWRQTVTKQVDQESSALR